MTGRVLADQAGATEDSLYVQADQDAALMPSPRARQRARTPRKIGDTTETTQVIASSLHTVSDWLLASICHLAPQQLLPGIRVQFLEQCQANSRIFSIQCLP